MLWIWALFVLMRLMVTDSQNDNFQVQIILFLSVLSILLM